MKKMVFMRLFMIGAIACHSQEKSTTKENTQADSTNTTPKGTWQVHKEYDDHGNLIRKDSTYTYSWSSQNSDEAPSGEAQALIDQMRAQVKDFGGENFMKNFDMDNLESFFSEGDFHGDIDKFHKQMMGHMDSLRQRFFNDSSTHKIPRETDTTKKSTEDQTPKDLEEVQQI